VKLLAAARLSWKLEVEKTQMKEKLHLRVWESKTRARWMICEWYISNRRILFDFGSEGRCRWREYLPMLG
jgi:hypothetical protein